MNITRILLAALGAFVTYLVIGGLGFALLPRLSPPEKAAAAEAKSGAGLNPGTPWEKAEND